MKLYKWSVTGYGHFPHDMLRYDNCWPTDTDSALSMAMDQIGAGREDWTKLRTINITGIREPTRGRWSSFGWPATSAQILR